MRLTDTQRELLEDKFILWDRASREGPKDLRDYNQRAADALKAALAIASGCNCAANTQASASGKAEVAAQVEREGSRADHNNSSSNTEG